MPGIPHVSKFVAMATATIAVACLSMFGAAASSASTAFPAAQAAARAQSGFHAKAAMTITGFDAKVAEAHGYRVFRFGDGTQVSVGSARLAKLGSHPTEASVIAVASGVTGPSPLRPPRQFLRSRETTNTATVVIHTSSSPRSIKNLVPAHRLRRHRLRR